MSDCLFIHGDARRLPIDPKLIDAIVSDPPYGISYTYGPSSRKGICTTWKPSSKPIAGDDEPFNPTPWLAFPNVAFTGAQWFYDRLPAGGSLHCWDKRGEYKPLDQADSDMVWINKRHTSRIFHLAWRGICRDSEAQQRFVHPTQKPVALMRWIMSLLRLKPNSLICDPYCGSGSTAIAAEQEGHRFIGLDLDREYLEIAKHRIDHPNRHIPRPGRVEHHPLFRDLESEPEAS